MSKIIIFINKIENIVNDAKNLADDAKNLADDAKNLADDENQVDDVENLVKKTEDQILEGKIVIFYNTVYNSNIINCINKLAKKHNIPIVYRLVISKL